MVERCVRDAEAAGSNPVTSTMPNVHNGLDRYERSFLLALLSIRNHDIKIAFLQSLF